MKWAAGRGRVRGLRRVIEAAGPASAQTSRVDPFVTELQTGRQFVPLDRHPVGPGEAGRQLHRPAESDPQVGLLLRGLRVDARGGRGEGHRLGPRAQGVVVERPQVHARHGNPREHDHSGAHSQEKTRDGGTRSGDRDGSGAMVGGRSREDGRRRRLFRRDSELRPTRCVGPGMRAFPEDIDKALEYSATVVVRTDFTDGPGWLATLAALQESPEDWDDYEADNVIIDDPAWAGATPDEVRDVVRRDGYLAEHLDVVVLADQQAVSGDDHLLLLVVAAAATDDQPDSGREFRCLPRETHAVSVNVGIGNMDFAEFAAAAAAAPDGVFRGWPE
jgi:hypothetical protein